MNQQTNTPKNVIIIGGQAAGCKTAAHLARLLPRCRITIIEKEKIISFGTCGLPYYVSGDIDDVLDLAKTPWGVVRDARYFQNAKGVKVLTSTEVTTININRKTVKCRNLEDGKIFDLPFNAVVIATGSNAAKPPFQYPDSPRIGNLHNPEDGRKFRRLAQTGKITATAILGGGFIGVELAEAMVSLWGIDTTIIEKENRLLPKMLDDTIAKQVFSVLQKNNISVNLNRTVIKIETLNDSTVKILLNNGTVHEVDYVFTCFGVSPENSLAESLGIKLGAQGGILVDDQMRSSFPGIWAVGDCVEVKNLITGKYDCFPLGSLANRQGRAAAGSLAKRSTRFPGAVGTASVKIFDFVIASSGLTSSTAKESNIKNRTIWATFLDRPDYSPGNENIFITMTYQPETLQIFGIQAAGYGEVTRYVDVISGLLPKKIFAQDLLELEHAYTPSHASPVSPLNQLGAMILAREQDGIESVVPKLVKISENILLDVRSEDEQETSPLTKQAVLIPQDQLRSRIGELDLTKPIHVVCSRGPRSYEAVRYLKNRGATDVKYVGGGTAMLLSKDKND